MGSALVRSSTAYTETVRPAGTSLKANTKAKVKANPKPKSNQASSPNTSPNTSSMTAPITGAAASVGSESKPDLEPVHHIYIPPPATHTKQMAPEASETPQAKIPEQPQEPPAKTQGQSQEPKAQQQQQQQQQSQATHSRINLATTATSYVSDSYPVLPVNTAKMIAIHAQPKNLSVSVSSNDTSCGPQTPGAQKPSAKSFHVRWDKSVHSEPIRGVESSPELDAESVTSSSIYGGPGGPKAPGDGIDSNAPISISLDSSIPAQNSLRSTVSVRNSLSLVSMSIGAQLFAMLDKCSPPHWVATVQARLKPTFEVPLVRSKYMVLSLCNGRFGERVVDYLLQVLLEREIGDGPGALCFCNNFLTAGFIPRLVQYIGYSSNLIALDLSCNPIGDEGVSELAKTLAQNATLHRLDLSFVCATDSSVRDICYMIQNNKSMKVLRLAGNQFQRTSISSIIASLRVNFTLSSLDLKGCIGYEQRFERKVDDLLARNNELKLSFKAHAWACHDDFCPTPWHPALWHSFDSIPQKLLKTIQVITPVARKVPSSLEKTMTVTELMKENRSLKELAASPETIVTMNRLEGNKTWKLQGRFNMGCSDTIGKRPTMEDVMVFCENFRNKDGDYVLALFDGHGGCEAANFASENILTVLDAFFEKNEPVLDPVTAIQHSIAEIHNRMKGYLFTGTTLAMAVILENQLYTANVGDSRIVLSRGGEPLRLTRDHKPYSSDEKKRIIASGGHVEDGRLNGSLGLSRALGDSFHWPQIIAEPYISKTELINIIPNDGGYVYDPKGDIFDEFLIIACDGMWDVLTDLEAVNVVRYSNYWENPDLAAQNLRNVAYCNGSTDNISVMIVSLNPPPKSSPK